LIILLQPNEVIFVIKIFVVPMAAGILNVPVPGLPAVKFTVAVVDVFVAPDNVYATVKEPEGKVDDVNVTVDVEASQKGPVAVVAEVSSYVGHT